VKPHAVAVLLSCLLLAGCDAGETDSSPIRLLDRAHSGLAAPVELTNETRKALTIDLASRLEFDLSLPESPILSFAIGASSPGRPTLLAPVVFRVLVDETEVFREVVRRSQGAKWVPRVVDLTPWSRKSARIALEAHRGDGGVKGAEKHVLAHWGNPVVRSRHRTPENAALILISVDCLRADHVGAYGYHRQTTPNLDSFARESTLFRNAMAVSSYTLPTHASMLTGLPPSLSGATQRRRIAPSVDSLPELLSREGYRVQGVVSAPFLSPVYGFADGFDTYRLSSDRAAGLVDQALELLDEGAGFRQFLFLHLFDVHLPYSPPREFIDRFGARTEDISDLNAMIQKRLHPESELAVEQARRLYDGEIAYVDTELGRFFGELEKRGLYDTSLVVVTGDHGEAFFEHGYWEHGRPWLGDGPGLYQEIVHVPLLVKRPGSRESTEVADVVSQTDIFPTFLEAAGSTHEFPWARTLLDHQERGDGGWALAEFVATPAEGGAILLVALRRGNLKYSASYRAGTLDDLYASPPLEEALYDLAADPDERHDLLPEAEGAAHVLRETLRRYLEAARARLAESAEEELSLDPELRRKLESLGYIER
jgi:arylsulfatase